MNEWGFQYRDDKVYIGQTLIKNKRAQTTYYIPCKPHPKNCMNNAELKDHKFKKLNKDFRLSWKNLMHIQSIV